MNSTKTIQDIKKHLDINIIYANWVFEQVKESKEPIEAAFKILKNKPKPFIKWVGGKRQLLKQFRERNLYPPEKFDPIKNTYFEPFLGGGAVFFDLIPKKAILSDLNKELVITYNVIKSDVEKLIKSLKKHKNEKDYFLEIRSKDSTKLNEIERASRFIFLNKTAFNGLYRVNSKGGFNVPFGKYSNPTICDEDNLRKVSEVLKNVKIINESYKHVLNKAKKGDFIYFDPPYYPINKTSSFTSYTSEEFLDKEQKELRDIFVELHKRGCYVMLSNSDTEFINDIYSDIKGVKINKVFATRAINSKGDGRGKIKEVLVTNY